MTILNNYITFSNTINMLYEVNLHKGIYMVRKVNTFEFTVLKFTYAFSYIYF